MDDVDHFESAVAQLTAELFARGGSLVQFPISHPELEVASEGDTAKAGMLAAALSLRRLLCLTSQGRQALRNLGFDVQR